MILYDKQPIENATVTVEEDNGIQTLVVEPNAGYKLRRIGDNTYSTMQIALSPQFDSVLSNYHTVPIDEPDEEVENPPITPTDDEELSAEEALSIITGGVSDETV